MAEPVKVKRTVGRPLDAVRFLTAWNVDVGNFMREWLESNERNASRGSSDSIHVNVTSEHVSELVGSKKLPFVFQGRRRGTPPPISPLIEWANTGKGRSLASMAGMSPTSFAFAIRHNIGERGTSPQMNRLRPSTFRSIIKKLGEPHLKDMATFNARQAALEMSRVIVKNIPNTTAKK